MTNVELQQNPSRFSVLYIEDNDANLRLVQQILTRLSAVALHCASEPTKGLTLAVELIPDLILLDINLPGMNGFEVLERLRQDPKTQKIPVFAISANAMKADIERARDAGFDDYVTKPFNVKEFIEKIETVQNQLVS